jgi:CBS domain-containing protein
MRVRETLERVPVEAVMTPSPVTVEQDAPLADAAGALLEGGFRHLPVLGDGRLVGMLSERDLRSHLGTEVAAFTDATLEALDELVSEAMTPDPISVRTGTPLSEALAIFANERVGAVPVLDEADQLVGILSYVDIFCWLRDNAERELRTTT